ncbi:MAG TPA: translocase [Alphaproteobacteria bacterium]|nr:translocase [Alphaproteobacteria bacterium]HAM47631.1 translocase [Alphaproteobacteria bacterium]HBA43858.1 translocase [Alphaproteobacteria bacterium]HBC55393.1 translocase [Alphaproteobacteria bacterium]HBF99735.1 translocase [Alphaproteobacteria bacterium]
MGQGFQFIDIIFFALIAGFILLRLRSVLGTRSGNEKRPEDAIRRQKTPSPDERRDDNVVRLPGSETEGWASDESMGIVPDSPLAQSLTEIQLIDRSFNPQYFLTGARQAYEMIISAFAKGDRETLRPLLNDDVFAQFDAAISERETQNQSMETELVRMADVRMADATLNDTMAEITVKFSVELISAVRNADGAILQGHPTVPQEVSELWTFARDIGSKDPNWLLIATTPAE